MKLIMLKNLCVNYFLIILTRNITGIELIMGSFLEQLTRQIMNWMLIKPLGNSQVPPHTIIMIHQLLCMIKLLASLKCKKFLDPMLGLKLSIYV